MKNPDPTDSASTEWPQQRELRRKYVAEDNNDKCRIIQIFQIMSLNI